MKVVILTEKQWREAPALIARRTMEHLNGWFLKIVQINESPYPDEESFKRLKDAASSALEELIGEVEVIKAFDRGNPEEAKIKTLKAEAFSELTRIICGK